MDDRKEYCWVNHDAVIQRGGGDFGGGIPRRFRFLERAGSFPAASAELIERLPHPPTPVIRPHLPQQPAPQRSGSWLWFIGILLLILVTQCSGQLFDLIK